MTGKVIQGSFPGGQPRLPVQPRIAPAPSRIVPHPSPRMTPSPVQTRTSAHPPGSPAPAFTRQAQPVQRNGAGRAFAVEASALGLASSGGRPLPEAVRGKMEAALGADFSAVRVHVGPQAARIGAIAFTVGSDIYFAPGRYQPETIQGQQLLGHELTHVVQQRAGRVRNPLGGGLAVVRDRALEAEADRLGQRVATHRVAVQAKPAPRAAQPAAPVRISPPVGAGLDSYRLSAGAGGREIGSVMVHPRDRGAVEVTDLGVDATQRGNGVGQMLVAAAARTGLRSGRSKVTLAAQDRGSGHLTRWYKDMGFTQVGMNRHGYPQLEAPISRVLAGTAQRKPFPGDHANRIVSHPPTQSGSTTGTRTLSRMWAPTSGRAAGHPHRGGNVMQRMERSPSLSQEQIEEFLITNELVADDEKTFIEQAQQMLRWTALHRPLEPDEIKGIKQFAKFQFRYNNVSNSEKRKYRKTEKFHQEILEWEAQEKQKNIEITYGSDSTCPQYLYRLCTDAELAAINSREGIVKIGGPSDGIPTLSTKKISAFVNSGATSSNVHLIEIDTNAIPGFQYMTLKQKKGTIAFTIMVSIPDAAIAIIKKNAR
jgi:ribosomal protein S18 acetylase RimI-like enzyme